MKEPEEKASESDESNAKYSNKVVEEKYKDSSDEKESAKSES